MRPIVTKTVWLATILTLGTFSVFFWLQNEEKKDTIADLNRQWQLERQANNQALVEQQEKIKQLQEVLATNTFQTRLPEKVVMDIPGYRQKYSASCEAASAHAAMKYFGVTVSEDQILTAIGVDHAPRYYDDQGVLHWGNPQEMFVGDYNAREVYVDGYGVYNKPIYNILSTHGFSRSISQTNWQVETLLNYLRQGYPIIAWVSNDYKTQKVERMVAPDGTTNPWILNEHAVVVRGVDRENIYVMDVGRQNSHYTVSIDQFKEGFANLNNMAIVVIPDSAH